MQHCRQIPFLQGKTLNLKNLVNGLPGWLQLQRKATAAPSSSPVTSTTGKSTASWIEKQREIQQKILEEDANRIGPKK